MADSEIVDTLRRAGPFRELDSKWIARFAVHASRRTLSAGEHIWHQGDKARALVIIERGLVAIQRVSSEGNPTLVALFGDGDALCVVPALQDIALPADAVAVSDAVSLLLVSAAPVLEAAREHVNVAAAVNHALLQHTTSLRSKIDIVSAGAVPKRIATLLLYLGERFGHPIGEGGIAIDHALTREQIGQLVNARTETVIRIMSRWSKAAWMESASGSLRISRLDMLERIAQGPKTARGAW